MITIVLRSCGAGLPTQAETGCSPRLAAPVAPTWVHEHKWSSRAWWQRGPAAGHESPGQQAA